MLGAEVETVRARTTKVRERVDAAADALVAQYRQPVDACVDRLRALLTACDGVEPMVEMEPIDPDSLDKLLFAVSGAPPSAGRAGSGHGRLLRSSQEDPGQF